MSGCKKLNDEAFGGHPEDEIFLRQIVAQVSNLVRCLRSRFKVGVLGHAELSASN